MNARTAPGQFALRQPVRRDSFDVNDKRAQVFRPIEGGIAFVDQYLKAFHEYANLTKRKGERHLLSANCGRVLEAILKKCCDFRTGICEPSLDTLMKHTGFARATVVRALKVLWCGGWIDWIRRTVKTDNAPGEGPQIKQTSNAYFFDLSRLPSRCMKRLKELMHRKGKAFDPATTSRRPLFKGVAQRRAERMADRYRNRGVWGATATDQEKAEMMHPGDSVAQAEYLAMCADLRVKGASSASGLNPPSRIKYKKE